MNIKWKFLNNINILTPRNVSSLVPGGSVKPTFWLNANSGQIISEKTYKTSESISSTYYMQFGARITFN